LGPEGPPELPRRPAPGGGDLAVREPAQPDSEHLARKLTLAVVLERLAAAVRSVIVGFAPGCGRYRPAR
jgi:hypothetical protein